MRPLPAVLAAAMAALILTGAARTATFGITDDAGKYAEDGGASFFSLLNDLGMNENRMTVRWDPAAPTTIPEQAFLDRAIPQANARGIQVVFSIYPSKALGLAETPNGVQLFAQFAAKVAARYPSVTRIICLNEGNQPRFHQPQFDAQGNGVAGALQEQAMAACYDALKAVNAAIDVIGFGFSGRGNDDFEASSNVSHSPLRLLKEIGDAYRASGRTRPIADDVALHCYPNSNTDAPTVGFAWPNYGCVNLDRFKQGWWDAFHGTGQPVFGENGAPGVRAFVDETGYQVAVPADKTGAYQGAENVKTIDEATQGAYYAQLIALMACDPNVALFNFFHAVDEVSLPGWQSGLVLADGTHRASYAAVKDAVARNRACQGPAHAWRHGDGVAGARLSLDADEDFSYTVRVGGSTLRGSAEARKGATLKLGSLGRRAQKLRVTLTAWASPARASTFARTVRTTRR